MTYEMCLNLEAAVFKVASQRFDEAVPRPIRPLHPSRPILQQ